MKNVMLLALLLVGSVVCSVEVNIGRGYHEEIGIPLAERIKAAEEKELEAGSIDVNGERIVGGVVSLDGAHPYLGGLLISFREIAGTSVCGSSLLTSNRLVTSAHCWFDGWIQGWQVVVVLGSNRLFTGGTRIATTSVIMHPQWNTQLLTNDVAMIYLPTRVSFTPRIQPIALPSNSDLNNDFAFQWATAVGYGINSDDHSTVSLYAVISEVNVQVITELHCWSAYGNTVIHSTLCTDGAGGVGICGGDSGGPLFINRDGQRTLIGIASFRARNGCQLGFPSGFARVTSFRSFITQHL